MSTATGHAVYDKTAERFITGVYDTPGKAESVAVKIDGHKYDTRKV